MVKVNLELLTKSIIGLGMASTLGVIGYNSVPKADAGIFNFSERPAEILQLDRKDSMALIRGSSTHFKVLDSDVNISGDNCYITRYKVRTANNPDMGYGAWGIPTSGPINDAFNALNDNYNPKQGLRLGSSYKVPYDVKKINCS